jgi:hypothetical protein
MEEVKNAYIILVGKLVDKTLPGRFKFECGVLLKYILRKWYVRERAGLKWDQGQAPMNTEMRLRFP